MAGGVIVSLLGVILLPLPGPGAVVVAGGLMMLASESIVMARILDWMDRRRATLTAKIRGKCKRLSRLSCFLLGVFVTILLAAGGIASWFWLTV